MFALLLGYTISQGQVGTWVTLLGVVIVSFVAEWIIRRTTGRELKVAQIPGVPDATTAPSDPRSVHVSIAPFEGSDRFAFQARLRYRIGDDNKLSMWFDLDRPHKIMEAAITDIWNAIEGKTGLAIYNGMPANP